MASSNSPALRSWVLSTTAASATVAAAAMLGAHAFIIRRIETSYNFSFSWWQWISHLSSTNKLEFLWRCLTARWRALPDVLILGEQKSGTTALADQFAGHPSMHGPFFAWRFGKPPFAWFDGKESQFLNGLYGCSSISEQGYRRSFPLRSSITGSSVVFDSSPHALVAPYAPARLHAWVPKAKLIVIVRNPVDRAFSQYQMYLRFQSTLGCPLFGSSVGASWSFEDLIDASERAEASGMWNDLESIGPDDALPEHLPTLIHPCSVLRRGMYAKNIERYLRFFSRDQLLVLHISELDEETLPHTMERVYAFIGVEPQPVLSGTGYAAVKSDGNRANYDTAMKKESRERLEKFFNPHQVQLAALKASLDACPSVG